MAAIVDSTAPKAWFEEWREPREFFRKAEDRLSEYEAHEILNEPSAQHLRDAYVAGLFARIWNDHSPCTVRLAPGDFPDAQLHDGGGITDFEITMADRKGRRMVQEHRQLWERRQRGELAVQPIDRDADRQHALEAIPRVCRQKAKKYLGTEKSTKRINASLLIYVNFSSLWGPVVTDDEMTQLTAPWKDNFDAIWLLTGARIVRVWPKPAALAAVSDPLS